MVAEDAGWWEAVAHLLLLWLLLHSHVLHLDPSLHVEMLLHLWGHLLVAAFYSLSMLLLLLLLIIMNRSLRNRWKLNRRGIIAAFLRAHGSAHVPILKESFVEADEADLTVVLSAVLALVASDASFERRSVSLKAILQNPKTTSLDTRLLLDPRATKLW